jgi:hypothetical protein
MPRMKHMHTDMWLDGDDDGIVWKVGDDGFEDVDVLGLAGQDFMSDVSVWVKREEGEGLTEMSPKPRPWMYKIGSQPSVSCFSGVHPFGILNKYLSNH